MLNEHKKLERLMLFREVAQLLSFTAAAEKISISRGYLSAQIRRLEDEMGMPLMIRSTRSVRLTAEGEKVLAGMEKIRLSLLELERNVEYEGQAIEGIIKITAPTLFCSRFFLDIVSKFRELHPAVRFSIDSSYTNYDLNRNDFDLAFRATNRPPENMIAKKLFNYIHAYVASPAYFAKHAPPLTPTDLHKHQCLRGQDQPVWPFIECDLSVAGWLQINDNQMLKQLALSDAGIVRLPYYVVDKELVSGELQEIFAHLSAPSSAIHMIYPQLIHQSKRLSVFIEFVRQYFGEINGSEAAVSRGQGG